MKIIGLKEQFTVEYKIVDHKRLMGYSKIWFGINSLGTIEDLIYIDGYLIKGLQKIANSIYIDMDVESDKNMLFNKLNARLNDLNDNEIRKYLKIFGTFCDDFTLFSFLIKNEINIIWKLNSNNTLFSDLNSQNLEVNHFKIDKNLYTNILEEIKENIKSNKPELPPASASF